jgi:hypothetical protein
MRGTPSVSGYALRRGHAGGVRSVLYWITTGIIGVAFAMPGVLNLIRAPHMARDMAHLDVHPTC